MPVTTLVIHTINRFNPVTQRRSPIRKRDLKNIVGRSGRAGKSLKGFVILSNPNELPQFMQVISDYEIEPVRGRFFEIATQIFDTIEDKLNLTNELLDQLPNAKLIGELDTSIVSLLEPDAQNMENIESRVERTFGFNTLSGEKKSLRKPL